MKTINETFTDDEHSTLYTIKKRSGLSWHDFIIEIAAQYESWTE